MPKLYLPNLFISEPNPELAKIWRGIFDGIEAVNIVGMAARDFMNSSIIDAIILNSAMAHERYGGYHKIGVSQILDTNQAQGVTRLVVTLPPYPLKGYFKEGRHGVCKWVNDDEDDHTFERFNIIFDSVCCFNENSIKPIQALGIATQLVNFRDINHQAPLIRQAYLLNRKFASS